MQRPDQTAYSIELSKITQIYVETNDSGPWGYDVWFVLVDEINGNGVTYPLGASGEEKATELLKAQFEFELNGMNSTKNEKFLCWSKFSNNS